MSYLFCALGPVSCDGWFGKWGGAIVMSDGGEGAGGVIVMSDGGEDAIVMSDRGGGADAI